MLKVQRDQALHRWNFFSPLCRKRKSQSGCKNTLSCIKTQVVATGLICMLKFILLKSIAEIKTSFLAHLQSQMLSPHKMIVLAGVNASCCEMGIMAQPERGSKQEVGRKRRNRNCSKEGNSCTLVSVPGSQLLNDGESKDGSCSLFSKANYCVDLNHT